MKPRHYKIKQKNNHHKDIRLDHIVSQKTIVMILWLKVFERGKRNL